MPYARENRAWDTRLGHLAKAGILALILPSCTTEAPDPDIESYVPPAWMAEQTQRQDAYRSQLQGCISGKGWDVTVTAEGGVEEPFTAEEYPRYEADNEACRESMGMSNDFTLDSARLAEIYDRQVDTWECLRHEGLRLQEPPSKETYIDDSLRSQAGEEGVPGWWAYGDPAFDEMGQAEFERLNQKCPEPWWAE